jgi:peptide/nickel transport system substrate-binding protein
MNSLAYDKLLGFTQGPGTSANANDLIPWLAQALPEQPDGQTYVFKIRPGVKFQNTAPVNGRPMTAEDVKFAIDLVRNSSTFKTDFAAVSSVDIPDAQTVIVKTSKPYAPLLVTTVGQYGWPIVPKEIVDSKVMETNAIGTGAYMRTTWEQSNKIVFKKNPDYWNKNVGFVDQLTFLVIPEPNSTLAALKTGQIDMTAGTTSIPCELVTGVKDANLMSYPSNSQFSSFDTTQAPFNDVRVRRAVALLYNRESEGKAVYCSASGGSSRTLGLLTQARALKPEDNPDMASTLKTDVKQAKDLLTAAGFANGFKADIAYTPYYGANSVTALEHFVGMLRLGGISLTPVSFEYARWIAEIYRPPYKWTGMCWGAGRSYPEPDQEARNWLYPGANTNQSRVNDKEITALIDKQATQLNPKERWETLHQIQKLEAKNVYYLWKASGDTQILANKRVHDFSGDLHYNSHEYLYAWVDA